MKLARQDGMSPDKYVGGVKPARQKDYWLPHQHEQFYHLLHSCGGHLPLVVPTYAVGERLPRGTCSLDAAAAAEG